LERRKEGPGVNGYHLVKRRQDQIDGNQRIRRVLDRSATMMTWARQACQSGREGAVVVHRMRTSKVPERDRRGHGIFRAAALWTSL
jgi:hypothetical protein